ncbi:MAG: FxsA family protein, partial [Propionicimonas sp.]|nr:FxsA family protein [Propionicimonas sp.]
SASSPARQHPPLLLWGIVALFVVIPIIEVWLLISVGHWVGLWPTVAVLLVSAGLGAWLMSREGSRAWHALVEAMKGGRLPTGRLADAALILVGGILLMLPGLVTDLLGLLFLLPATRPLVRRAVGFVVARQQATRRTGEPADTVIPGEIVEPGIEEQPD